MENINQICFVCNKPLKKKIIEINKKVYLQVCLECKGTENEKKTVEEFLDSLADGLVHGCI